MESNIFQKNTLQMINDIKEGNVSQSTINSSDPNKLLRKIVIENKHIYKSDYILAEQAYINHTNLSKALNLKKPFPKSYFLKILIALKLDLTQINQILKQVHLPILYPKNSKKDYLVISGIINGYSVSKINLVLEENNLPIL